MSWSESERQKYQTMWNDPLYRCQSPGQRIVNYFDALPWEKGQTLIDIGCGTGRAARALAAKGLIVSGFDIAENCLDPDVKIPMLYGCLWDFYINTDEPPFDWFYCTDVMEHIPPENVDIALERVKAFSKRGGFFNIALFEHIWQSSGAILHLTVMPRNWWLDKVSKIWKSHRIVDAETSSLTFVVEN